MDLGDSGGGFDPGSGGQPPEKRVLPDDLPRSLDDRKHVRTELVPEIEMYDGWQGKCCPPRLASPRVFQRALWVPGSGLTMHTSRTISVLDIAHAG